MPRRRRIRNTADFISNSERLWGEGVFDYSRTTYETMRAQVTLICVEHETEFSQRAEYHLHGAEGCTACQRASQLANQQTDEPDTYTYYCLAGVGHPPYEVQWNARNDDCPACRHEAYLAERRQLRSAEREREVVANIDRAIATVESRIRTRLVGCEPDVIESAITRDRERLENTRRRAAQVLAWSIAVERRDGSTYLIGDLEAAVGTA